MSATPAASLRERVVRVLHREMDAILAPAGYIQAGGRWSRTTAFARTWVELQRSSSGLACYLNLGRLQRLFKWEWVPPGTYFTGWRICDFTDSTAEHNSLDALAYGQLDGDSPLRAKVMTLLAERALPFLTASHSPFGYRMVPPRLAALREARP
jgi:hypothetical protein